MAESDQPAGVAVDRGVRPLRERLQACIDDPMWANHAEVPKVLLRRAVEEADALRAALLDANQLCRSAFQISNRIATKYSTNELGTYFGAFSERAHESLKRQHETILATGGYLGPDVNSTADPAA